MNLPILLKDYAAFNLWANHRIVAWLRTKPEELLDREIPSSFPSLAKTLLHIWGAQDIWLNRLQGISPTRFLADYFVGSNREILEGVLQTSASFRDFLLRQSTEFFSETADYAHTNGKPYNQNRAEILLHCFQHSTFHRAQLITMGRALGLTDPPETDYIEYVRLKSA